MEDKELTIEEARELVGEEYKDFNIEINRHWAYNGFDIIVLTKDDIKKKAFYNCEAGRLFINVVDASYSHYLPAKELNGYLNDSNFVYGLTRREGGISIDNLDDSLILFSFEINGKIRAFWGLNNHFVGMTCPIGFDLSRQEFIRFPLDENGIVDENKMKEALLKENETIGFDPKEYYSIDKYDARYFMRELLKDDYVYDRYDTYDRLKYKINEYNHETVKEIANLVHDKLYTKKKGM